ncbi:MAG TPA: hypothetical protein VHC44_15055 [Verrucomicrobiae bacterium]|nr:hypothetical protein [Verrucomicrobiae bacterium]
MTEEKIAEMVLKIDEKTAQTGLSWEKTTKENEFQAVLGRWVVRIREDYLPQDDANDYTLSITDYNGTQLESLTDSDLVGIFKRVSNTLGRNAYQTMRNIYKNAKRQAMGVDQAVDEILSELNSQNPPSS